MLSSIERLCLWPLALYVAFPRALVRRYSYDYYGQSVPLCPILPKPAFLFSGKTKWFPGSCLVTAMGSGWFPNTFSLTGSLRTGPLTIFRYLWPSAATFRFPQPSILTGLQFSWHHRPRMPAVGWSYLTFVSYRLTPAHPFLHVRLLAVGLRLTTRTCPLEADQLWVAWFQKSPG